MGLGPPVLPRTWTWIGGPPSLEGAPEMRGALEGQNWPQGRQKAGSDSPTREPDTGARGQRGAGAILGREALASSSTVPPGEWDAGPDAPSPHGGRVPMGPSRGTKRPAPAAGDPEGDPEATGLETPPRTSSSEA